MTDGRAFQQYFKSMSALGRNFQLGDLYDYRSDRIIKDDRLSWKSSALASVTQTEYKKQVEKKRSNDAEFKSNNKKDSMSLDNHVVASIMIGLINNYKGASNFLNDQPNPKESTLTLGWTFKSKEEFLELEILLDQQGFPPLPDVPGNHEISDATHVVVGVFYGAQVFCVLAHTINSEEDEAAKSEAQESLSKLAKKFDHAMELGQDVAKFKEKFNKEEKHLIAQLKCRFYSDFQTRPSTHQSGFFDAYHHCDMLAKHIQIASNKAVPISVLLCPLNILFEQSGRIGSPMFGVCCDVDEELVNRWGRILADLKRVVMKTEKLHDVNMDILNRESLGKFLKIICDYQNFIERKLRSKILLNRSNHASGDYGVQTIASKAENHSYFRPCQLERWLTFKRNELDTMDSMASATGNGVTFLVDQLSSNKKYALVLFVPPPSEWTNAVLSSMKTCIGSLEEDFNERNVHTVGKYKFHVEPWYMIQTKRRFVLDMIRNLANYAEQNKEISSQVEFIVTFGESNRLFGCSYSVYEGEQLLKSNLRQLPIPPTGLRIGFPSRNQNKRAKTTSSSIEIEWDYEDLGFPHQFVVEYRVKGDSNSWIQQRTTESGQTQLDVSFPTGTTMEIRVAAETCIGRSGYSDVIDTADSVEEVDDVDDAFAKCPKVNKNIHLQPPSGLNVKVVSHNSVELELRPPPGEYCCLEYRVSYWKKGENYSSARFEETVCGCTVDFDCLEPETTYLVNIVTFVKSSSVMAKVESRPSETLEFTTTKEIRFAEKFVKRCPKIGEENGLDLYAVPLAKWTGKPSSTDRFVFGAHGENFRPSFNNWPNAIMLVGASGSGKTSLINCFINYIFDVNLEDPFRFQLIDPSQAESRVTVYDIYYDDRFRIWDSLKIIDIPSYVDNDAAKNREINEMIRNFFEEKSNIKELDMIGFVMDSTVPQLTPLQLFIYSSLITIFGRDAKENITFLFTSCDNVDDPSPLLAAIEEVGLMPSRGKRLYKFNSSVFSCRQINQLTPSVDSEASRKWDNFHSFFYDLAWISPKCVLLSKQVLDERNRLESTINGLDELKNIEIIKFKELKTLKRQLRRYLSNEISDLEIDTVVAKKESLPFGMSVTNCSKCQITCHTVCGAEEKCDCDVMDHSLPRQSRTCLICNCSWGVHSNDSYCWFYERNEREKSCSFDSIKEQYETKLKKTLTAEELMEVVGADMEWKQQDVVKLIVAILNLIQHLIEIANRLELRWPARNIHIFEIIDDITDFISVLIYSEKEERRQGFEERVKQLKYIRRAATATRDFRVYEIVDPEGEEEDGN